MPPMDTNQAAAQTAPAQDAEGNFIPPPIKGYQKLSPEQIAGINAVKDLGAEIERAMDSIEHNFVNSGARARSLALARTNLQQGLMWASRSIADPTTFA